MSNKFTEFCLYINKKTNSILFKFAVYSIMISALLLLAGEYLMVNSKEFAVKNNFAQNIMVKVFCEMKIVMNFILIIICLSCRTMFDLTEIPEIFERFSVSFVFLTIITIFIKIFSFNILTECYKQIIDYEVMFVPIVSGLFILALMTWTPYNSIHIKDMMKIK